MTHGAMPKPNRRRTLVAGLVCLALFLVAGANAHLLYVALVSQPDCVAHAKVGEVAQRRFSAAGSAC